MATIKEIAMLAGVSRGTVDRVLNNREGANAETRKKVLEIAKQLDYKPNKAGAVLAAHRRFFKFGVVMFGTNNPFFDEVKEGILEIEQELKVHKCQIFIKHMPTSEEANQAEAIDELVKQGINALALCPQNDKSVTKKVDALAKKGIPTITFNSDLPDSKRLAYVGSNYRQCGQTCAGLTKLFNHEAILNIGIISGAKNVLCHTERIEGFKDIIGDVKNANIIDTVWTNDDDEVCYKEVSKLLARHPEINALYFTAGATMGGCQAIKDLKKENDILVIAHDKTPATVNLVNEGIIKAVVCQQPKLQGTKPLQMLFDYLATGEKPEELNYTDTQIVIKENL